MESGSCALLLPRSKFGNFIAWVRPPIRYEDERKGNVKYSDRPHPPLVKGVVIYLAALAAVTVLIIVFLVSAIWWAPQLIDKNRQRDVEPHLKRSGEYFSQIADDRGALQAAGGLGYVQGYYLPGSEPGMEALQAGVEKARSEAVNKISTALFKYSGTNFGTNAVAWQAWASNRIAQTKIR
jgi:hypothetical protein